LPGEPLLFFEFALTESDAVEHIGEVLPSRAPGWLSTTASLADRALADAWILGGGEKEKEPMGRGDDREVDTAVLYAVNVGHGGLRGLDLGSFLVKQAFGSLRQQNPEVKKCVTLSPVPGFKSWLEVRLARACRLHGDGSVVLEWGGWSGGGSRPELVLTEEERERLMETCPESQSPMHAIRRLLGLESSVVLDPRGWHEQTDNVMLVREPLLRWCAEYLTTARHMSKSRAQDPALNFHMRNGAQLDDIYWGADDTSSERWEQSFGIMCRYEYHLDDVENNNYKYITQGHVSTSEAFTAKFEPPVVIRAPGLHGDDEEEGSQHATTNLV